ncbi:MGMT family protein [Candidatus Micrarchaeota archaeon]|nr:MGMT family protein [Candidatus Micrarchaeota archaeon]
MSFAERVYLACARIPKGRVSTYGEIARALGCRAYRAVGNALNKNPFSPEVPCHRVVKADGSLGGFARGARKKKESLEREGIKIKNGTIEDFEKVFFRL